MKLGLEVRDDASAVLRGMAGRMTRARPAFQRTAERIAELNRRDWPTGPPLAQSTRRQKQRLGQPSTPLVATGATRADLTSARRGTRRVTDRGLEFGTDRPGARFAQTGTRTEPRRRVMADASDVAQAGADELAAHIAPGGRGFMRGRRAR